MREDGFVVCVEDGGETIGEVNGLMSEFETWFARFLKTKPAIPCRGNPNESNAFLRQGSLWEKHCGIFGGKQLINRVVK